MVMEPSRHRVSLAACSLLYMMAAAEANPVRPRRCLAEESSGVLERRCAPPECATPQSNAARYNDSISASGATSVAVRWDSIMKLNSIGGIET